jgi:hypothetical protein
MSDRNPPKILQKGTHEDKRGSDIADAAIALCRETHHTVAQGQFCAECLHKVILVVEELEHAGWLDSERRVVEAGFKS